MTQYQKDKAIKEVIGFDATQAHDHSMKLPCTHYSYAIYFGGSGYAREIESQDEHKDHEKAMKAAFLMAWTAGLMYGQQQTNQPEKQDE